MSDLSQTDFNKRLLDRGLSLLTDPLSELTHKRQTNLLIASVVTILFSFALVSTNELTLLGTKLKFANPAYVRRGFVLLTSYFLILYGLGLLQDYTVYFQITRPAFAALKPELDAAISAKQEELRNIRNSAIGRNEKAKPIWDERWASFAAYREQTRKLGERSMEVARALLEIPPRTGEMTSEEEKARTDKWTQLYNTTPDIEEQIVDMEKQYAEEDQRFESLLQACEADPSEWDRLLAALDQSSEERYARTVVYLTNAGRTLGTVRAVFEVVGPLAFGVSAIASGLLRR